MSAVEQEYRTAGRPCATCAHPHRADIERTISTGDTTISAIAVEWSLSPSGLRRHRDRHMVMDASEIRAAGLDPVDYLLTLSGVVERLQEAMDDAEGRGDTAAVLKIADPLRRAAGTLVQYGVKNEDTVLRLELERDLRRVLGRLASRSPDAAKLIAAELDRLDRPVDARELRSLIHTTRGALT
ncbi:hypothetical protein [Microbacterium sp. P02]|uniref:hypothetical protein n=1 Tax=Microbacterium sp. P02 TaxID=3366260 RepID=UPI003672DD24